jgi:hypothetical protein
VNYLQTGSARAPTEDNKQAKWRMERLNRWWRHRRYRHHAYNLACFVSRLRATSLSATLSSIVAGRSVDDDARITL